MLARFLIRRCDLSRCHFATRFDSLVVTQAIAVTHSLFRLNDNAEAHSLKICPDGAGQPPSERAA
jgi:hypothetical protein